MPFNITVSFLQWVAVLGVASVAVELKEFIDTYFTLFKEYFFEIAFVVSLFFCLYLYFKRIRYYMIRKEIEKASKKTRLPVRRD